MSKPTVGVVIPCAMAHLPYVNDCVASVKRQSYRPTEIALMVDVKEEGTPAMLNLGVGQCLASEYVAVVHGDDLLEPWHLKMLMAEAAPDRFCYGDLRIYAHGEKGGTWPIPTWDFEKAKENNMCHGAILFPRAAWEVAGGYPEEMNEGREDWAFSLRLAAHGIQGHHVTGKPGYLYRKEGQGRSDSGKGRCRCSVRSG